MQDAQQDTAPTSQEMRWRDIDGDKPPVDFVVEVEDRIDGKIIDACWAGGRWEDAGGGRLYTGVRWRYGAGTVGAIDKRMDELQRVKDELLA